MVVNLFGKMNDQFYEKLKNIGKKLQLNTCCKYHPQESANWRCNHCEVYFCINCIPNHQQEIIPKCTLCRHQLSSLSIAEHIPPFWEKFGWFFSFPFKKSAMIVMLMYALIVSLLPEGKIGMVIFVLMLFPLSEFLFELMEQVANGEELNPSSQKLFSTENKGMFTKLLLTYIFIAILLNKTIAIFGEGIGYSIAAFFVLGMPASFIILMMEKTVFSMINPAKISYIIKLFGWAYLLLYLIAIASITMSLHFSLLASGTSFLAELLVNILSIYFVIVLFTMMGYLVFQHHYELNYNVRLSHISSLRSQKINEMTEVDIFLRS